jgi:hypothetical protein
MTVAARGRSNSRAISPKEETARVNETVHWADEMNKSSTKVIGWAQMTHFDGRFSFSQTSTTSLLHHNSPSFDYDVKVVAGLALPDDRFSILKTAGFQRVGYRVPLPFLQRLCSIEKMQLHQI